MNCETFEKNIPDYLDKSLKSPLMQKFETHLQNCKSCQKELEQYNKLNEELKKLPTIHAPENLKNNFNRQLEFESLKISRTYYAKMIRIAAGFALFIAGAAFMWSAQKWIIPDNSEQLSTLQNDVNQVKTMMMMQLIDQESPSTRIKAVNYAEEITKVDPNVINALITRLNTDQNSNVRLAAAYALEKFAYDQTVRNKLIHSLSNQKDPLVQIALINILVNMQEHNAIEELKKIMEDENNLKEVRQRAEYGVGVLI